MTETFIEFPRLAIPDELPLGRWLDMSYHNDITGRVEQAAKTSHGNTITVWVHPDDVAEREYEGCRKFVVCVNEGEETSDEPLEVFETDFIHEVLEAVARFNEKM